MTKLTIAQCREREVIRLAQYKDNNPTEAQINEARHIMNSFYRLCGLCERNLYLANDSYWHDKPSTKASEEREQRWLDRLKKALKPYGLTLYYGGYCPSIGTVNAQGGCSEKITRYFY